MKIDEALVKEAQDGHANEIACGMMAMGVTAAVLFLRANKDDAKIGGDDHAHGVNQGMLVKAKAEASGLLAAKAILAGETNPEEIKALAGSVACLIAAHTLVVMTARACGVDPYRVLAMVEKLSEHVSGSVEWRPK